MNRNIGEARPHAGGRVKISIHHAACKQKGYCFTMSYRHFLMQKYPISLDDPKKAVICYTKPLMEEIDSQFCSHANQRLPVKEYVMSSNTFVAYYRVSTARQGMSGLGLEAQRASTSAYVIANGGVLLDEITEIESGKKDQRPKLRAAIEMRRKTGATLIIAELDRLARKVAFFANLMESGVRFVAVDMPNADRFMRLCCTNPMRDSSCESSVVAGLHEQTHISRLQDQELARIQ